MLPRDRLLRAGELSCPPAGLVRPRRQAGRTERGETDYHPSVDSTFGEMLDTSPERRKQYYALLGEMSVEQRAAKVASLSRAVRGLVLSSIQQAHPDADLQELLVRLSARLYGPELTRRVYGWVPEGA